MSQGRSKATVREDYMQTLRKNALRQEAMLKDEFKRPEVTGFIPKKQQVRGLGINETRQETIIPIPIPNAIVLRASGSSIDSPIAGSSQSEETIPSSDSINKISQRMDEHDIVIDTYLNRVDYLLDEFSRLKICTMSKLEEMRASIEKVEIPRQIPSVPEPVSPIIEARYDILTATDLQDKFENVKSEIMAVVLKDRNRAKDYIDQSTQLIRDEMAVLSRSQQLLATRSEMSALSQSQQRMVTRSEMEDALSRQAASLRAEFEWAIDHRQSCTASSSTPQVVTLPPPPKTCIITKIETSVSSVVPFDDGLIFRNASTNSSADSPVPVGSMRIKIQEDEVAKQVMLCVETLNGDGEWDVLKTLASQEFKKLVSSTTVGETSTPTPSLLSSSRFSLASQKPN